MKRKAIQAETKSSEKKSKNGKKDKKPENQKKDKEVPKYHKIRTKLDCFRVPVIPATEPILTQLIETKKANKETRPYVLGDTIADKEAHPLWWSYKGGEDKKEGIPETEVDLNLYPGFEDEYAPRVNKEVNKKLDELKCPITYVLKGRFEDGGDAMSLIVPYNEETKWILFRLQEKGKLDDVTAYFVNHAWKEAGYWYEDKCEAPYDLVEFTCSTEQHFRFVTFQSDY